MSEENVLQLELDKLDAAGLKRVAQSWGITRIGKDKKAMVDQITEAMQDEFCLKGVLEKLTATQVTIYISILKSKATVLTLGEIARKIGAQPVNTEMELGVLKRYFLVYQRKNRERLTNNMDRYYYFPESGDHVSLDTNEKGQKFRTSFTALMKPAVAKLPEPWQKILKDVKGKSSVSDPAALLEPSLLTALIDSLSEVERDLVLDTFMQGGICDITKARDFISAKKGKWEEVVRKLHDLGILIDDYYIDEKFIRLLIMPAEVFSHLQENPLLPLEKKGTKKRQEKKTVNNLDFYLNIKKMIVYISRKGLNLAKSGKLKQIDLKETETRLLQPDIGLFIEKSQIYQIELLLPVMRLLDILRVKRDDVVLRNDYNDILLKDPIELMDTVIKEMAQARHRRVRYEDVFEPLYVPFYDKEIFDSCISWINKKNTVLHFVIIAAMVRERLVLAKTFRIKNFQTELEELMGEITSALFYLQLLGLISVEYPDRRVEISELGKFYIQGKNLQGGINKGGIIINPDLTLIAIPEQLSIKGLDILKSFAEVKNFDNVYTFQITKESFQEGLLLGNKPEVFTDFLKSASRNELPQNLLFSIEDWSRSLPMVTITDECVVLQTTDPESMDLLLGQIAGKKIVTDQISPTTILIDHEKIYETISYCEKLNLIVKLIR